MEEEMQRMLFFETARQKAEAEYRVSPKDADNLTRWGGALLELAHFQQTPKSLSMVEEAKSKLEEALQIDSKRAETLWWLGNSHIAHGFLIPDQLKANELFESATESFQKAVELEPSNELYTKALEMAGRAPSIYTEIQKQMVAAELSNLQVGQASTGGSTGTSSSNQGTSKASNKKGKKKKKGNGDFKYDVLGWVVLALGIVGWIGLSKIAPPRPMM